MNQQEEYPVLESYLDKLTDLQSKIGYIAGPIHPVAFLGLLGEAGEVAAEVSVIPQLLEKSEFVQFASELDSLKKSIRRGESEGLIFTIPDTHNFDMELADTFYYLKAVAANRGLTIEDLARMSYEKVIARRGPVKEGDPAK